MPKYEMNDAAIDLPANFTDKTMHLFTVDAAGSSSFTFVVSRAPMEKDDTVDTFVTRLVAEMRKTLPRFELKHQGVREVDGETAREVDYQWVSEGSPLHQRQTVVMSPMSGEQRMAISFIGTCPKTFSAEKRKEYDTLIDSVVLKRPDVAGFIPTQLGRDALGFVFVLHEGTETLYVLTNMAELMRHDVTEMSQGVSFFEASGAPLTLRAAPEGQQAWKAPDGRQFALWTTDPKTAPSLHERLTGIGAVKGTAGIQSVAAVRAYLATVANAS